MLNAEKLMASELVALSSHEVIGAALLLWCRAWKQRPAASLPNDDNVIAAFARMPLPRFKKLREQILRGFVLCSDGRLYHRTLSKEAEVAFAKKLAFQRKRETDAERLRNWRSGKRVEAPSATHDETHGETRFVAEGQGQGQGHGQGIGIADADASASSAEPTSGAQDSKKQTVPCPYRDIVARYHEHLPMLPKVRAFDGPVWDKRTVLMRKLWAWVLSSKREDGTKRAETAQDALNWIGTYFATAAQNSFVVGLSRPSAGHEGWKADIDYLLSPNGIRQVLEKTQVAA